VYSLYTKALLLGIDQIGIERRRIYSSSKCFLLSAILSCSAAAQRGPWPSHS